MNYELVIGIATLMVLVHKAPIYHRALEALMIDGVKPWSCIMCSTFWYSIIPLAFTMGWESIFISSSAAILAELIDIQINKL
tara:strand:+ start:957 stop:1202 length:246 start_codon:yes stop_codon:yes gene_type:complete